MNHPHTPTPASAAANNALASCFSPHPPSHTPTPRACINKECPMRTHRILSEDLHPPTHSRTCVKEECCGILLQPTHPVTHPRTLLHQGPASTKNAHRGYTGSCQMIFTHPHTPTPRTGIKEECLDILLQPTHPVTLSPTLTHSSRDLHQQRMLTEDTQDLVRGSSPTPCLLYTSPSPRDGV